MPQPDVRSQVVAGPLQNVSVAFKNESYIANAVFPIIDKVGPKAQITTYPPGAWFRDEAGVRAAGTRAKRGGYTTTPVAISLVENAFAKEVTDEDRRNAEVSGAPPIQPEIEAVEFCSDKIDMRRERLVRDLIVATTWVDGASGGTDADGLFAAGSGNVFLKSIKNAKKAIKGKCGVSPNKLVIDYGTYLSLTEEATLLDKIKYTQRGVMTRELMAQVLDLKEVLVGDAVISTAKENKGATDFTASLIWEINAGKGMVFLFYAPDRPGLKVPAAGYQCRGSYENGISRQITMWRENAEHQDVFEAAEEIDVKAVGASCGYLWKDTLLT